MIANQENFDGSFKTHRPSLRPSTLIIQKAATFEFRLAFYQNTDCVITISWTGIQNSISNITEPYSVTQYSKSSRPFHLDLLEIAGIEHICLGIYEATIVIGEAYAYPPHFKRILAAAINCIFKHLANPRDKYIVHQHIVHHCLAPPIRILTIEPSANTDPNHPDSQTEGFESDDEDYEGNFGPS